MDKKTAEKTTQSNESDNKNITSVLQNDNSSASQLCKVEYQSVSLNFNSDSFLDRNYYRFREFILRHVTSPVRLDIFTKLLQLEFGQKFFIVDCVRAILAIPEIAMVCDQHSLVVLPRKEEVEESQPYLAPTEIEPRLQYSSGLSEYSIEYVDKTEEIKSEISQLIVIATRTLRGISEALPVVRYLFYRAGIGKRVMFAYCDEKGRQNERSKSKFLTCRIISDRITQPITFLVPMAGVNTHQLEMMRLIYLMHTNLVWCTYEPGKDIMKLAFPDDNYALYYAWDREIRGYHGHSKVIPPMGYLCGKIKETQFTLVQGVVHTLLVQDNSDICIRNEECYALSLRVTEKDERALRQMASNSSITFSVQPGILQFSIEEADHHRLRGLRVIIRSRNPRGAWGPEVTWARTFHISV
jgi:hypothetical protein